MIIQKLQLENFRIFRKYVSAFKPGVNIVMGGNGDGKTTLLEAIALLSSGLSFKARDITEIISEGSEFASVDADISICTMPDGGKIIDRFRAYIAPEKKQLSVNGKKLGPGEYYGRFGCVPVTDRDMLILRGAPADRRRFIDRAICSSDPVYLADYLKYQKALKQRNALLKRASEIRMPFVKLKAEISSWDELLAEGGAGVIEKRENFLKWLNETADKNYFFLFGSNDRLSMEYRHSVKKKLAA